MGLIADTIEEHKQKGDHDGFLQCLRRFRGVLKGMEDKTAEDSIFYPVEKFIREIETGEKLRDGGLRRQIEHERGITDER